MKLYFHCARGDFVLFHSNSTNRRNYGLCFPKDSDARHLRDHLLQQFESLSVQVFGESSEPGDISTRMGEAIDDASRDRIHVSHHNDGNRLGRLLGREDRRYSSTDKDIDLELQEFDY